MAVTVHWDNPEKTVLRYDLEGVWTWEEYYSAVQEGVLMRREMGYEVDIIANLEKSERIPANVLSHMSKLSKNRENRGFMVLAGGGGFLVALVRVYTRIMKSAQQYVRVTDTVEEARRLLHERAQAEANKKQEA